MGEASAEMRDDGNYPPTTSILILCINMSRFKECWDRLEPADAHAKAFTGALAKFLDDKPYRVLPLLHKPGPMRDSVLCP